MPAGMRSIWKGAVSFGLVTIPVKLYSATQAKDVAFHQVHAADGGRIRYKRTCSIDGEEVPYAEIAKGYELPSGEMVVLTDEDLADLPLTTSRTIDVLTFVPLEQVDPIYFEKTYYLEPDKAGVKPYVLLRDALEQSGRVAVVKIALRNRESLATLRVRDGVFVLETMLWPDEIRESDFSFLEEDVDVRPQELAMATSLIETLAGDFQPEQYTDAYREALETVIEAKIEGAEVVAPPTPQPTAGTVVDLMAALRASVEAARQGRAGGGAAAADDSQPASSGAAETEAEPEAGTGAGGAAKAAARKGSTKKATGKSTAANSAAAETASTKTASTKTASTKSAAAKRTPAKKAAAKRSAAQSEPAKKAAAKRASRRSA